MHDSNKENTPNKKIFSAVTRVVLVREIEGECQSALAFILFCVDIIVS